MSSNMDTPCACNCRERLDKLRADVRAFRVTLQECGDFAAKHPVRDCDREYPEYDPTEETFQKAGETLEGLMQANGIAETRP